MHSEERDATSHWLVRSKSEGDLEFRLDGVPT